MDAVDDRTGPARVGMLPGANLEPAPEAPTVPVRGWGIDLVASEHEPVIVNPEASASALLGWGEGQLARLNELLEAIGCAPDTSADATLVAGAARHFSEQVHRVLVEARNRLRAG